MQSSSEACALLVQLVERRSPKPNVGGSSPPGRAQKQNPARKLCSTTVKSRVDFVFMAALYILFINNGLN